MEIKENKDDFKITLKAARINANLDLLEAAKLIGIGKDTLIKWEKDAGLMNAYQQQKVCEVYDVPISRVIFLP